MLNHPWPDDGISFTEVHRVLLGSERHPKQNKTKQRKTKQKPELVAISLKWSENKTEESALQVTLKWEKCQQFNVFFDTTLSFFTAEKCEQGNEISCSFLRLTVLAPSLEGVHQGHSLKVDVAEMLRRRKWGSWQT